MKWFSPRQQWPRSQISGRANMVSKVRVSQSTIFYNLCWECLQSFKAKHFQYFELRYLPEILFYTQLPNLCFARVVIKKSCLHYKKLYINNRAWTMMHQLVRTSLLISKIIMHTQQLRTWDSNRKVSKCVGINHRFRHMFEISAPMKYECCRCCCLANETTAAYRALCSSRRSFSHGAGTEHCGTRHHLQDSTSD